MERRCRFQSLVLGGFECSTHFRRDGTRLDLIAATHHDKLVREDYRLLKSAGIHTARDGVRWHLIEPVAGQYRFESLAPMVEAARATGMQVIWDLFHYGWPRDLDIFSPAFVDRFARFARAFARFYAGATDDRLYFCPINEISFFSWAAGDFGIFFPYRKGCGDELKAQLVRAHIAAVEAIRDEIPSSRVVTLDPLINVVCAPDAGPEAIRRAERHNRAQFDAWDMILGRIAPRLGGSERYLDIMGVNYYIHNQWIEDGRFIERSHALYRPFWSMLESVYLRYRHPLFVSETGIEDARRREWFRYVCDEIAMAMQRGVPVEGVCLYPIVNHPGWDDDRHCCNGLWDYCESEDGRACHEPLKEEVQIQTRRLENLWHDAEHHALAGAGV